MFINEGIIAESEEACMLNFDKSKTKNKDVHSEQGDSHVKYRRENCVGQTVSICVLTWDVFIQLHLQLHHFRLII